MTTTNDTDDIRRNMVESGQPQADLDALNPLTDETWDTEAMQRDFEPLGFAAPFIIVRRRSDGVKGSLEFTHSPRVYFNWVADK
jgi:hypothetical protein